MLNELDQGSEEDIPALLILFLVGLMFSDERGNEFFLCDLKQEIELFSFSEELDGFDEVL